MTLYATKSLGLSVSDAGLLITFYGLGSLLGTYAGGWLSIRWGTYKVQLYSLILSGFGFILLGEFHEFRDVAIAMFLLAMVSDAFRPANASAIGTACPPQLKARCFGLNRLAINLGMTIGPAVGGFLAAVDYRLLFWADGITCLAAAIVLAIVLKPEKTVFKAENTRASGGFFSPLKDRVFLILLVLLFSMGLVFSQMFSTWPLFLGEIYLFKEEQIGLFMALNTLLIVLFEMPLIRTLESKNQVFIMAIGALFLFVGFSILPISSMMGFVIFTVVLWTVGEMLVFPIAGGLIANRSSDEEMSKYMGLFTFTFSLAIVFGPFLGTRIYVHLGPNFVWYFTGIIGLFAMAGFYHLHLRVSKS